MSYYECMLRNFSPEPTTASPSVCGCGGRFAALVLRRHLFSGGCGSARRWAAVVK
jgi:hypothetical protein